jgi:hypothetical protein
MTGTRPGYPRDVPLQDQNTPGPVATDRRELWQRRLQEYVRGGSRPAPAASPGRGRPGG